MKDDPPTSDEEPHKCSSFFFDDFSGCLAPINSCPYQGIMWQGYPLCNKLLLAYVNQKSNIILSSQFNKAYKNSSICCLEVKASAV